MSCKGERAQPISGLESWTLQTGLQRLLDLWSGQKGFTAIQHLLTPAETQGKWLQTIHRPGERGACKRKWASSAITKLAQTQANKINLLHHMKKLPLKSLFITWLLEENQFFARTCPTPTIPSANDTELWAALCPSTWFSSLYATKVAYFC